MYLTSRYNSCFFYWGSVATCTNCINLIPQYFVFSISNSRARAIMMRASAKTFHFRFIAPACIQQPWSRLLRATPHVTYLLINEKKNRCDIIRPTNALPDKVLTYIFIAMLSLIDSWRGVLSSIFFMLIHFQYISKHFKIWIRPKNWTRKIFWKLAELVQPQTI